MPKIKFKSKNFRIVINILLFTCLFIAAQISINLFNSSLTIESRSKKYNSTHTAISISNYGNELLQEEVKQYLNKYLDVSFVEVDYFGVGYNNQIEPYLGNDYNNYEVIDGKPLENLDDYDLVLPISNYEIGVNNYNIETKLGERINFFGSDFFVSSFIDNIHFSEKNYSATSSELSNSIDDEGFNTFITSEKTMRLLKDKYSIHYFGKRYKVVFDNYTKENEQKFLLDFNNAFKSDVNVHIKLAPFYSILEAGNNINKVIGVTINVVCIGAFLLIILAIYTQVAREYSRNRYLMSLYKTIGVSDNWIAISFLKPFVIMFALSMTVAYVLIYFIIKFFSSFTISMFLSTNIRLYLIGFAFCMILSFVVIICSFLYTRGSLNKRPRELMLESKATNNKIKMNPAYRLMLAVKFMLTADYKKSFITGIVFVLSGMILITTLNSIGGVYTVKHIGLNYDLKAYVDYHTYNIIKDEYAESTLLAKKSTINVLEISESDGDVKVLNYIPVVLYSYCGQIEKFLDVEIGNAPQEKYGSVISYKLANDLKYEIYNDKNVDRHRQYVKFYELSPYDNMHRSRIEGITTILSDEGNVVYQRILDDQVYNTRIEKGQTIQTTYLESFKRYNNGKVAVYVKLKENVNMNELSNLLSGFRTEYKDSLQDMMEDSKNKLGYIFSNVLIMALIVLTLVSLIIILDENRMFFEKNKTNLGVLKSMGLHSQDLFFIVLIRGLILYFSSIIISIVFFVFLAPSIIESLGYVLGVYKLNVAINNIQYVPLTLIAVVVIGAVSILPKIEKSVSSLLNERSV